MVNDMFIGFIFGIIIGMLLSDLLWYLYVEREFYPILAYVESVKQERKLQSELEKDP